MRSIADVKNEVKQILLNRQHSFEMIEEILYRVEKALVERDEKALFGAVILFKPDNVIYGNATEEWSDEAMKRLLNRTGVLALVKREIQEIMLHEIISGKFPHREIDAFIMGRAKRAIMINDMAPLKMSVTYRVESQRCLYSWGGESVRKMAENIGLYQYVESQINPR